VIALPLAILTTVPSRMLVAVWEDGAARPMSSGTKSRERRERVTDWSQHQIRFAVIVATYLRGGCRHLLFRNIREEIIGGLYDDPHRII